MSELLSHNDLVEELEVMSVREILEYALNKVREHAVVVFFTYHYNHDVVMALKGDLLYMVDQ